ncbi:MAG: hypothetical protein H7Y04_13580, partial [Verrucomicrobia bacterium]|nr:hypothetical protein [Cytophagales bacterium]
MPSIIAIIYRQAMFSKYTYSLLAVLLRVASGLAINKIFALYFGGAGITLLAHLQNLLSMATAVPGEGVHRGMTKYLSDESLAEDEKKHFLGAGIVWMLVIFICVCLVVSRFSDFFLGTFLGERHPILSYFTFLGILLAQLVYLTCVTLLLIQQRLHEYLLTNLYATMAVILAVSLSVSAQHVRLSLLAYAIGQAVPLIAVIAVLFRLRNQFPAWLRGSFTFSAAAFRQLSGYAFSAVAILIFSKVVSFYIRQWAIKDFGLE